MRPRMNTSAVRPVLLGAIVAASLLTLALAGCTPPNLPDTETSGVPSTTGTVQAIPDAPSATSTVGSVGTTSGATTAQAKIWPTRVSQFRAHFKGPVWYPKYVTKGYKIDSLDVVEFDPGSGLVCDIVWVSGERVIEFTQGSPKTRDYPIVSVGKVPWGTETADIVYQDPSDHTTPKMIVYSNGGNFAELSGDVGIDELKVIAAGMVAVK